MTVTSPIARSVYQNDRAETVGSYRSSEEETRETEDQYKGLYLDQDKRNESLLQSEFLHSV